MPSTPNALVAPLTGRRFHPGLPALLAALLCFCSTALLPGPASASPSSALREYQAGKYDQALQEYERLLQKKSDDPRLHYNAGAAAYRNQQFEEAAKQFHATLASPDLNLQGLAYYNEGNALYHLGERAADPKQRTEAWEKALQNYQTSMKLTGQDPDAKHNYEFVKRKLEELKQQQQQSKNDKSDQSKNQDQQQQQDQQNQKNQDQPQKEQQQQQNQPDQKQDSSQKQQQQQQQGEEAKQQEKQQAAQNQEQKDQQSQAQQSASPNKESAEEKEQEAAAAQAKGQMTQQQAQQLLDAQKGKEQMLPAQPKGKPQEHSPAVKDW